MTTTRLARACRRMLVNASWAIRSRASSASGCSGTGSPVRRSSAATPTSADQRCDQLGRAPGGARPTPAGPDAAPGPTARSSSRLSRAVSRAVAHPLPGAVGRRRRRPSPSACSADSSWVTTLMKPWATVSCSSRASRSRSASTPECRDASASSARVAASCGQRCPAAARSAVPIALTKTRDQGRQPGRGQQVGDHALARSPSRRAPSPSERSARRWAPCPTSRAS